MIDYTTPPRRYLDGRIPSFIEERAAQSDEATVDSFGAEWNRFSEFADQEIEELGDRYFHLVKHILDRGDATVLDVGCGSGRWSKYLANKVARVEAIDPSTSVFVAEQMCRPHENIRVTQAGVYEIPFPKSSFDLVYAIGVLHHVPDTTLALKTAAEFAKPGGEVLVYLYYSLDGRGALYKALFHATNVLRKFICQLPQGAKNTVCDILALLVYWPLSRLSLLLKTLSVDSRVWRRIPLSFYHDRSLQILRNDALDRFGTPLEQRFTREECHSLMQQAGLTNIRFMEDEPYWCVAGRRPDVGDGE